MATRPQDGVNWLVVGEHVRAVDTLSLPLNNKVTFAEPLDEGGEPVPVQTRAGWASWLGGAGRGVQSRASVGPNVQVVGHWESRGDGKAILRAPAEDRSERRFDLMGIELRCLTHEWPPVTIQPPSGRVGAARKSRAGMGGTWDVLKGAEMNFTSKCLETTTGAR
ncbi:hypothetical protein C7M84_005400 [Penaeus vannamei]|uniref:Uncharacterized protein n=1 Tax=Penaeus vannamei TaxID=6689 RepID=A0A3R7SUR2_PENVA|nr:hypothetical protein C7M84_005400 [Penaeus vannamei]